MCLRLGILAAAGKRLSQTIPRTGSGADTSDPGLSGTVHSRAPDGSLISSARWIPRIRPASDTARRPACRRPGRIRRRVRWPASAPRQLTDTNASPNRRHPDCSVSVRGPAPWPAPSRGPAAPRCSVARRDRHRRVSGRRRRSPGRSQSTFDRQRWHARCPPDETGRFPCQEKPTPGWDPDPVRRHRL